MLKDKPRVEGRPGVDLPPVSFTEMEQDLKEKCAPTTTLWFLKLYFMMTALPIAHRSL